MNYVCKHTCQIRSSSGKIHFCEVGTVYEFDKDPGAMFQAMDQEKEIYKLDFLKASKDELLKAKWNFKAAKKVIQEAYDVELFKEEGTKKSEVVEQILDARFRSIAKTTLDRPRMD